MDDKANAKKIVEEGLEIAKQKIDELTMLLKNINEQ